ncbi:hypothetical protein D3C78_1290360 [compost metagenome]
MQPADTLFQRVTRGQDQHRHILPGLTPLAQQIQPVQPRQAEIEDHRIIRCTVQGVLTDDAIGKPVEVKPQLGQARLDAITDQFVVFNQQNSHALSLWTDHYIISFLRTS